MKPWKTLPPNIALTLTDSALRTIELPVLPALLGRKGADVVIEHPSVCLEHAILDMTRGVLTVRDLGSRNGTFVNGNRIREPQVIKHQDELTLGAVNYKVGLTPRTPKRAGAAVVDPYGQTAQIYEEHESHEASRPMMLVVSHHGTQRQYLLDKRVHVIGRMADIRVADPALSRKHVQIEIAANDICLKDLASANGTFVDGHRISIFRASEELVFSAGDCTFFVCAAQRR